MKRSLLLIGLRVAVSAAFAVPILLFWVLSPHNRALSEVDRQANRVTGMYRALDQGQIKLKNMPAPKDIELQTFEAAREHALSVNTLLPIFNIDLPEKASILSPEWKGLKITMYNDIVGDPEYNTVVAQAITTLKNGKAFLDHHYAIMRAVANVLDYNPAKDTESSLNEEVYNSLQAAKGGLELTGKRIKDAQKYEDESIQDILVKIEEIEITRKAYENAVSANRLDGPERSAYIASFASAQEFIIADRQKFWEVNYKPLLDNVTLSKAALWNYHLRLSELLVL